MNYGTIKLEKLEVEIGENMKMNYKYMRIQGRENSYITKYPKGIFSLCWNLVNNSIMSEEDNQLFISIDEWFKENLPEPEPCKNHEQVITFFKCNTSKEMIEKIMPAIALLDKYNKAYEYSLYQFCWNDCL